MAEALRQLAADPVAGDWLTVDEAAALAGGSVRGWRRRAAWEAKQAAARLRPSLAVLRRPAGGGGKEQWYVHLDFDGRLRGARCCTAGDPTVFVEVQKTHSQRKVDEALKRARWLEAYRKGCRERRGGGLIEAEVAARVVQQAKRIEGEGFGISYRSLRRWDRAYDARRVDGRKQGLAGLIDGRRNVGPADPARSAEAVACFYQVFRTENKLSVRTCHEITLREAGRNGWCWPASYGATVKWLNVHDNRSQTYLDREGYKAWAHRFLPHLEEDWGAIVPGDLYVADHTQVDFWVTWNGRQLRPWLTSVQDCASRKIVGWRLSPAVNQEVILSALLMAFREAIPKNLRTDNGKDFKAQAITGLTKAQIRELREVHGANWKNVCRKARELQSCDDHRWQGIEELGVKLIYAIAYAPQSKGTLERWHRTFEDQCAKTFPTYCGNTPAKRPECLDIIRKGLVGEPVKGLQLTDGSSVPTLDSARERIGEYLVRYHATPHRGEGMNGACPNAVWAAARSLGKADDDALAFLLGIRGALKVGANGVAVTIGGKRFGYGALSASLRPYKGRNVLVSLDPEFPALCYAFEVGTRKPIGQLEPNKRMHPLANNDDLREYMRAVNTERKVARNYARNSAKRTRSALDRVNADLVARNQEVRATGTDENVPMVKPVRTGFEGVPRPVQTGFGAGSGTQPADESGSIEDLFSDHDSTPQRFTPSTEGMDDLLSDDDPLASGSLRVFCNDDDDQPDEDDGDEVERDPFGLEEPEANEDTEDGDGLASLT